MFEEPSLCQWLLCELQARCCQQAYDCASASACSNQLRAALQLLRTSHADSSTALLPAKVLPWLLVAAVAAMWRAATAAPPTMRRFDAAAGVIGEIWACSGLAQAGWGSCAFQEDV